MKSILTLTATFLISSVLWAEQTTAPYIFKDEKVNPATEAKNQSRTGTCWCFATVAMIESDLLIDTGKEYDLSEMWVVRQVYYDKMVKYVRMHGHNNFDQGGNAHDVPMTIAKVGIVPEEVYPGMEYGGKSHNHGELISILKAYGDAVIKNGGGKLSPSWLEGLDGILDAYFGKRPASFTYNGKEYTPKEYAKAIGIKPENYITITSYTHHPFYTQFALEIPDNWVWGTSYNVPIDVMQQICDQAIECGRVVGWNTDVSEKLFKHNMGLAILPVDDKVSVKSDGDHSYLVTKDDSGKEVEVNAPLAEVEIDQEYRQRGFDNYTTTDDHSMLIYGIAKSQNGDRFYKVKNSYGSDHFLDGSLYASRPFVIGKSTTLTINVASLSKQMKEKLGL